MKITAVEIEKLRSTYSLKAHRAYNEYLTYEEPDVYELYLKYRAMQDFYKKILSSIEIKKKYEQVKQTATKEQLQSICNELFNLYE